MSLLAKNSSGTVGPLCSLHLHSGDALTIDSPSSGLRRSERIRDQVDQGTPPQVYASLPMSYPLVNGVGKQELEAIEALEQPLSIEAKLFQPYCLDCIIKNRECLKHNRMVEEIVKKQQQLIWIRVG